MKRGDRYIAYIDQRPSHRLFIEVTRVARDGTWADIRVCTWAVMWTKRQPLTSGQIPAATPADWDERDLYTQNIDWELKQSERRAS